MNKFVSVIIVVVVAVLAVGTAGVAYAQSPNQAAGIGIGYMGRGGNANGGDGILHDYMIAGFAEKLGISATDLEARIESGETMAQIALSTSLTIDQFRTLMIDVRSQAIEQALNDGVLTQAQADWMLQRGAGRMDSRMVGGLRMRGNGQGQYSNPNCPYYNQTTP